MTSIDAIRQNFPAIASTKIRIDIQTLLSLPEKLRKAQSDFARTGGLHAAGIFACVVAASRAFGNSNWLANKASDESVNQRLDE